MHDTLGSFAVHPDNYFSGLLFTQVPYRGSPPDMDLFFGARYHRITMPCDPVPSRRRKDQGDFFFYGHHMIVKTKVIFLQSPYDSLMAFALAMTTSQVTTRKHIMGWIW